MNKNNDNKIKLTFHPAEFGAKMVSVARFAKKAGVECEVSLENKMACGVKPSCGWKRHNTIPHLNWRSILQGLSKRRSKKSLFSSDLCGTNRPAVNDGVLHGMK